MEELKQNLDKSAAEKFLKIIDPDKEKFSFYCFHPDKSSPSKIFEHYRLDDVWDKLCDLNLSGYGVYYCVNPIQSGKSRKKNTIESVRAVWQEDDKGFAGALPLKPHLEIETSKGKYHRYFLSKKVPVENGVMEDFEGVMRCMVQNYGSDKNVIDISRVLRVPGLYNTKGKKKKLGKKGGWYLVRIKKEKSDGTKRYSWNKIKKRFPYSRGSKDKIKQTQSWDRSRIEAILNISNANSYYKEMLGYSMSLANRGSTAAEIEVILEALLSQGLKNRPKQDVKVWEERMKMIPQFAESAVRKVREEGLSNRIDPSTFLAASVGGWDFLREDIGELEYALEPKYLQMPSITMVHAITGLGKTFFNLSLGMALSVGANFLKWSCTKKKGRKVLYIDGEMTKRSIQDNIRTLTYSFIKDCDDETDNGKVTKRQFIDRFKTNFKLVNIDMLPDNIFPDLTLVENQKSMDNLIDSFEPEVVFIDNLSTVFKTAEDDQKSWQPVQDWIIGLRSKGISVVLIHHDNKTGEGQRGFSKKQDIINYAIHLKKPPGYDPQMGARFEVFFTKTRDLYGQGVKAFEARLEGADVDENGDIINEVDREGSKSRWSWSEHSITALENVVEMVKGGMTYNEICKEIGVSKGTITYNVKKALKEGMITDAEVRAVQVKRMPRKFKDG